MLKCTSCAKCLSNDIMMIVKFGNLFNINDEYSGNWQKKDLYFRVCRKCNNYVSNRIPADTILDKYNVANTRAEKVKAEYSDYCLYNTKRQATNAWNKYQRRIIKEGELNATTKGK